MLKTFIVLLLLTFVTGVIQAQTVTDSGAVNKPLIFVKLPSTSIAGVPVVPQGFAVKNLPFFCDKEYKLEKITKIPFRFRLGSVEYCDQMEGKHH